MVIQLSELIHHALDQARTSDRGRFAELVVHDGELRQSVVALTEAR